MTWKKLPEIREGFYFLTKTVITSMNTFPLSCVSNLCHFQAFIAFAFVGVKYSKFSLAYLFSRRHVLNRYKNLEMLSQLKLFSNLPSKAFVGPISFHFCPLFLVGTRGKQQESVAFIVGGELVNELQHSFGIYPQAPRSHMSQFLWFSLGRCVMPKSSRGSSVGHSFPGAHGNVPCQSVMGHPQVGVLLIKDIEWFTAGSQGFA